jgi:phosphatidate cytidylyltransferase
VLIRLVLAPVVLGVVLGVIWLHDRTGNPLATDLLFVVVGGLAALEMGSMLRAAGKDLDRLAAVLFATLLAGVGLFASGDPALRAGWRAALVAAALVAVMVRALFDLRSGAVETVARSILPVLYVGLLLSFLRDVADGPLGARRLIWVVVTAKASDIGGWLVGKPFGKHKLVPRISPGKSWEGLAGGLVGSALAAALLPGALGLPESSWGLGALALFGLAIGAVSVLAGITQSGWKRRLGAKDSSRLIPEMGGVLDMTDSLLLAGPLAALWLS